jgi:glycosyltransferase involved in cell wall biosynthesis
VVQNPADDFQRIGAYQQGIAQANPPEILIVGMINGNKGQRQVSSWLEKLAGAVPDFRIVLAGRGERMLNTIQAEVKRLGMSDRVVALGYLGRAELYRAYARATIVACPNVWPEPFGRVPLEAGLSMRPVVAYASGGVKENVLHGKTGLLVEPGDVDGFVDAVASLLKDPRRAEEFGRMAYEHVTKRFTIQHSARSLEEAWSTAIAGTEVHHCD